MLRLIHFVLFLSVSNPAPAMAADSDNTFVMGPFLQANTTFEKLRIALDTLKSIPKIRALTRDDTVRSLTLQQRIASAEVETTKFQDFYKGLEVMGSMALHHEGPSGVQISDEIKEFDIDTTPRLSAEEAVAVARSLEPMLELRTAPELKIFPNEDGSAQLVYLIDLAETNYHPGTDVIINAHSGEILANLSPQLAMGFQEELGTRPHTRHRPISIPIISVATPFRIALVQVMQASSDCQVLSIDGSPTQILPNLCKQTVVNSTPQLTADASARAALSNAKRTLEYYKKTHGRDSYDNRGAQLINLVHVGFQYDNAFWNSEKKMMGYGDGDGVETKSFTGSLDVAGHELTHGITAETAALIAGSESGALNEAFSDYFGKMISNDGDWSMGKKIFLDPTAKGIRNLANPGSITAHYMAPDGKRQERPYPAKMSQKFADRPTCDGTNDRCWVHINSTIPSHTMYLIHTALGRAKAEKLIFTTLTQYLTSTSRFSGFKTATMRACHQLYDATACETVKTQFAAVGL